MVSDTQICWTNDFYRSDVRCIFSLQHICTPTLLVDITVSFLIVILTQTLKSTHSFSPFSFTVSPFIIAYFFVSIYHLPSDSSFSQKPLYVLLVLFLSLLRFTYVLCISTSTVLISSSDCLRDTNPFDCQLTITIRL